MSDDERVVVADSLWPHEAGMLQGILEAGGVQAFVRGALSTSGDIPGPVSSISVRAEDEADARTLLAGVDTEGEPFVCERCGETTPAGYSECPLCAEAQEQPPSEGFSRWGGLAFFAVLAVVVLAWLCSRLLLE